jgi:hypothetical protein
VGNATERAANEESNQLLKDILEIMKLRKGKNSSEGRDGGIEY